MKKLVALTLAVILSFNLFAEKVEIERAKIVAKNLYYLQLKQLRGIEKEDLVFYSTFEIKQESNLVFYIFNIENGFVIVSADDLVEPILGFSLENEYSGKDLPPALVDLLAHYKEQISYAIKKQIKSDDEILAKWEFLTDIENLKDYENCEIWPKYFSRSSLLTTSWNQNQYYNHLCPDDIQSPSGYDDHVPAGCVAVAMAQVMNYWDYPTQGTGSHGYYDPPYCPDAYGLQDVNFGSTTYQWSSMPCQLDAYNNAVATLIYHCGVSVDMDYGYDASGSFISKTVYALENYYSYSTSAIYKEKEDYTNSAWDDLLRNNLRNYQPILYEGFSTGGHAFVLDGFMKIQTESYTYPTNFHVNWGWGGNYNGNYVLTDLTPGPYDYTYYQEAVVGIKPSNITYPAPPEPGNIEAACSPHCAGMLVDYYIDPVCNATSYEWKVTGPSSVALLTPYEHYVSVYGIRPETNTLWVRGKNHDVAGPWQSCPLVIEDCEGKGYKSDGDTKNIAALNKSPKTQQLFNEDLNENKITIFPNPIQSHISIYLPDFEKAEIKLYDLHGIIRKSVITESDNVVINTNGLENGMYILRIISDKGVKTRTIQILK